MKKISYFILFFMCSFRLQAIETIDPTTIHSGEASYNGESLSLTGDVVLEHPLGIISTKRLTAYPDAAGNKKIKFSFLILEDDISIKNEYGFLKCQKAELDFNKLEGIFKGHDKEPDVLYQQQIQEDPTQSPPLLQLKSHLMQVKLEQADSGGKRKVQIASIQAIDDVRASCGEIKFATPHTLFMSLGERGGKRIVHYLEAPRETTMIYPDKNNGVSHKTMVHGITQLDLFQRRAWLKSPLNQQGEVEEDKQVFMENSLGEMYADEVEIAFTEDLRSLTPSKIYLKGHVKIQNRFAGHLEESSGVLQYALADQLEYDPIQQEVYLHSNQGNRVLFFDAVNNVQMSAPALKIIRRLQDDKATIQGVGDVRFTFLERELNLLQSSFQLKDSSESSKN